MTPITSALAASDAFQAWVGADDASEAGDYIFPLTNNRGISGQSSGYNCAVVSHGAGWSRTRVTLGTEFLTTPEYLVEFVSVIDVSDTDRAAFNTLLSSIAGILAELEAQEEFVYNDAYFDTQETPQRAEYGSRPDWVSATLVFKGDDWQGEI